MVWGGEVVDRSGQVVPQSAGKLKGATTTAGDVDLCLKQVGTELTPSLTVVATATVKFCVKLPCRTFLLVSVV